MSTLSVYSFEDKDGNEYGTWNTQNYQEAKEHAQKYELRLMENIYEWQERVPVEGDDYTPKQQFPARYLLDEQGQATGTTYRYCSERHRDLDTIPLGQFSDEDEAETELPTDDYQCDYCGKRLREAGEPVYDPSRHSTNASNYYLD